MFIYPYKKGSKSAKDLAFKLNCKSITRPKRRRSGLAINWGSTKDFITRANVLNKVLNVSNAVNKLKAFQILKDNNVSIPEFTSDKEVAKQWIEDGDVVFARTILNGHSGKGIVVCEEVSQLPDCQLYVKYFKKSYEYRVHIFNGKVIDAVQKRKRNGEPENYNKYIRCHSHGWVFCRENLSLSNDVKNMAVAAVNALGLDFGAVDIVSKSNGESKVLEVNTAPALQNTTLESYVDAIREYIDENINT